MIWLKSLVEEEFKRKTIYPSAKESQNHIAHALREEISET